MRKEYGASRYRRTKLDWFGVIAMFLLLPSRLFTKHRNFSLSSVLPSVNQPCSTHNARRSSIARYRFSTINMQAPP